MVFALKSSYNNRYLRFRHEAVQTYGLLQGSADNIANSYAQFEILNSNTYCGLFHIRCRYNNKYLVRWSPYHYWITASANKPNDNQKDWACTLFRRIDLDVGSSQQLRLMHVELGHYVGLFMAGAPFDFCLYAGSQDVGYSFDVFTFVNLNKLHNLCSKRVAFKGDNGKYLGAYTKGGLPYLQFSYDNPNDPEAIHEIVTNPHGIVHIKSNYSSKFWRSSHDHWIIADSNVPTYGKSGMFRTTPLGINRIALVSLEREWYIKRHSQRGIKDCLNAAITEVDDSATLEVVELGRDVISD